jgi:hypothetical protein
MQNILDKRQLGYKVTANSTPVCRDDITVHGIEYHTYPIYYVVHILYENLKKRGRHRKRERTAESI